MACGPGNTSFPILPPAAIDQTLYDSVRDTVPLQFMFGPRASHPLFSVTATALIDEGSSSTSTIPTLRYNGLTYTLIQAQITKPLHKGWILSSVKRDKNVADLTLILKNSAATGKNGLKYVFVSIPLLRETVTVVDPLYLASLAGQQVNGPFSLSQCIPTGSEYASYSTCLEPNPWNAFSLVFYQGLSLNAGTLDAMATAAGNGGIWPSFKAPTDVTLMTTNLALTPEAFRASVRISTLGSAQSAGEPSQRVDNTNAYQCVPLDPDRDIANGKITIDTSTGIPQPMNKLLGAREAMRADAGGKPPLAPGEMETIIAAFLGILLCLSLVIGGVYAYVWYRNGSIDIMNTWPAWVREFPWLVFTAVLFSFAGFLVGALTR